MAKKLNKANAKPLLQQANSQSRGNLNRCDGPFLLNQRGDLYFLLHKNIVHNIHLNKKNIHIKKCVGREKRYTRKRAQNRYSNMQIMTTKTTTPRTRPLRPRCLKLFDLSASFIYCSIVSTFSTCQVFFPKCYLNKVCFELLQNLT